MKPPVTSTDRPSTRRWLALILLLGLALRITHAVDEPRQGRSWDERYALKNVRDIVLGGTLAPGHYFYPSPVFNVPPTALVALSNALYRATGNRHFLALDDKGRFRDTAYLLCRLLQVVYGTLALWLVFLLGRRLFSARAGLVACASLAFMPWMIRASSIFKPDALLVLTILAAFYASLRAVASTRLPPYLLAGLAIGLAMSSKLTGGVVALPLLAATAIGWRDRRRWGLLAAAALASVVAFVALNPYWRTYGDGLAYLQREYAVTAGLWGMTQAEIPGRVLELLLGEYVHGPIFGSLALAGLGALAVKACRRGTAVMERTGLAMMLVFPPLYVAAYALQTPNFKPNNFLPVVPFTALAAAWLMVALWRRVSSRLPLLATRSGGLAAAGALAVLLVPPGNLYVYRSLVPSTEDAVHRYFRKRLAPAAGRSVVIEPAARRGSIWEGRSGHDIAEIAVDRLDSVGPTALDLADAEVFSESRLRGRSAAFYRARIERLEPDQVRVLRPRFLRLRGPALVALLHRRTLLDRMVEMPLEICDAAPTCFDARLPADILARERVSLGLSIPFTVVPRSEPLPPIHVAGRTVELLETTGDRSSRYASTPRLILSNPRETEIRFEAARPSKGPLVISLFRWAGGPRHAPSVPESNRRRETDS